MPDWLTWTTPLISLIAAALAACILWRLSRAPGAVEMAHLKLLAEQALAASRQEAETTRASLAVVERALATRAEASRIELQSTLGSLTASLLREQAESRVLMEFKLREMSEQAAHRLGRLQEAVNEQLHAAVEKQMHTSFQRVIDQFGQLQKAMVDVQSVTASIGDIKRIFSNVKTRGGWGEMQLRALLEDLMPGGFEVNQTVRTGSNERVDFVIRMPAKGERPLLLPMDAKFPVEDYERLLRAAEDGDLDAERSARRGLETRLRTEARSIADKYIHPPLTVEFAVLYLPTDGLYVEAARMPGLIEEISRVHRVLIMGPSLTPALLRTIQLGFVTLAMERNADMIHQLLGATRTEMGKMDETLGKLTKQAGTFQATIEQARKRSQQVIKKLRTVDALESGQSDALLELEEIVQDAES